MQEGPGGGGSMSSVARTAAAGPPAAPGAGAQGGQERSNPLFGILRMFVMWYLFKQFFGGGQKPASMPRSEVYWPRFEKGTPMDFSMFLSEQPDFQAWNDTRALVWRQTEVPLAEGPDLSQRITYHPSQVRPDLPLRVMHCMDAPGGLINAMAACAPAVPDAADGTCMQGSHGQPGVSPG